MVTMPSSIPPAQPGEDNAIPDAELPARIASGPGFWTDWLAELDRQGLLEELLASDVVARALREAPAGHRYDRTLTATSPLSTAARISPTTRVAVVSTLVVMATPLSGARQWRRDQDDRHGSRR
jgi:hypothetical protein